MPNQKPDRRVQRTRQQLRQALLSLMLERGYDSLSVQDITDRANLGRATFYLHYQDKGDLLVECMESLAEEFVSQLQSQPTQYWSLEAGAPIEQIFLYASQQAALYRVVMSSQGGVRVSRHLHELIAHSIQDLISHAIVERGLTPQLPLQFISNYYAGSLLSLVFWWLEAGMPYPSDEMARMFRHISWSGRGSALGITPC